VTVIEKKVFTYKTLPSLKLAAFALAAINGQLHALSIGDILILNNGFHEILKNTCVPLPLL